MGDPTMSAARRRREEELDILEAILPRLRELAAVAHAEGAASAAAQASDLVMALGEALGSREQMEERRAAEIGGHALREVVAESHGELDRRLRVLSEAIRAARDAAPGQAGAPVELVLELGAVEALVASQIRLEHRLLAGVDAPAPGRGGDEVGSVGGVG